MTVLVLPQKDIPAELLERIERRRKEVFIDRMGWPLTHINGRETDQFDGSETLMILVGDPLVFSMRIIPEPDCMVRELWPHAARHITPGSYELSRWVSHSRHSLEDARAAMASAIAEMRRLEWWDVFAVSTDRVAKAQGSLWFDPDEQYPIGSDINLCKWSLRGHL